MTSTPAGSGPFLSAVNRSSMKSTYDTIICDHPLPGHCPRRAWLQTKDLDGQLSTYRITKDGRLKGPYGCLTLTGKLHFHAFEESTWYEYEAEFVRGHLQGIVLINIDK
jgi:hypothetical protein